jgi:hypothetical protein
MSLLKTLKTDESIKGEERDSVGGFGVVDSGLYAAKIALAYVTKSAGGAIGLVTSFKTEDKKELRQTFWMTNKQGQNFYEKDGQKNYLPGFNQANALALLTLGTEIADIETEEKVVNVYSAEARAEVPTKVQMLVDLLDKEVILGVQRQIVDKTAKDDKGVYQPTGDTREENEVDKIFRAKDKMTVAEIRAGAAEAKFIEQWAEKFTGKTRDRTTKGGGTAGAPKGAAAAAAGTSKPKSSLFGN